jgi:primosomal protein N'
MAQGRLISLIFECPHCKVKFDLSSDKVEFYHHDDQCDLCGSHGEISIDTNCTECKKGFEVEISSW